MKNARTKQQPAAPPPSAAVFNMRLAISVMAEQLAESAAREARMLATVKALEVDNRNLQSQHWRITAAAAAAAERDKPVEIWMGCKAAARAVGAPYQTVLAMCNSGAIVCEKPFGRWNCEMNSLRAEIAKQRPGGHTKTAAQVAADQFKRVRFP